MIIWLVEHNISDEFNIFGGCAELKTKYMCSCHINYEGYQIFDSGYSNFKLCLSVFNFSGFFSLSTEIFKIINGFIFLHLSKKYFSKNQ